MYRLLLFFAALASAGATQVSLAVNCGGSITSQIFTLPPFFQQRPEVLCVDNGYVAHAFAQEFVLLAVGEQSDPFLRHGGNVSARTEFEGRIELSNLAPDAAFWSACVNSSIGPTSTGVPPGFGVAFGAYGPFGIGAPCDFGHAEPAAAINNIPEYFTLDARGAEVVQVFIGLRFFDSVGNEVPSGFHYAFLPDDIPEPSSFVLVLVPLGLFLAAMRVGFAGGRETPVR